MAPLRWRLFYEAKIPREKTKTITNKRIPKKQYTYLQKSMGFFRFFVRIPLFWCFTTKKNCGIQKKTPLTSTPSGSPKQPNPSTPKRGGREPALWQFTLQNKDVLVRESFAGNEAVALHLKGNPPARWKLLEVPAGISGKTSLETFPKKKTVKRGWCFRRWFFWWVFTTKPEMGTKILRGNISLDRRSTFVQCISFLERLRSQGRNENGINQESYHQTLYALVIADH